MKKIKIMPFGDSITNGYSVAGAYRNRLCELLEENGYAEKIEFVGSDNTGTGYNNSNEGHSGWAIADISADMDVERKGRNGLTANADMWLDAAKPDIVILQVGTNDVISLYDVKNAPKRLEALVDKVLAVLPEKFGRLYLASIPYFSAKSPLNNTGKSQPELDDIISEYNEGVKSLVHKKASDGYNVEFVNINGVLELSDLQDGVHPTAEGYAKMGELWFKTLRGYIDKLLEM